MTETAETTRLLSIREAATLANVSRVHMWRLVRDREIPAIRVGDGHGPIRIDRDELIAWLHSAPDTDAA